MASRRYDTVYVARTVVQVPWPRRPADTQPTFLKTSKEAQYDNLLTNPKNMQKSCHQGSRILEVVSRGLTPIFPDVSTIGEYA